MNEPTVVEARFDAQGQLTVLSFTWHGAKLPVTSTGREWVTEAGRHFLLMTTGERVFELVYAPARGVWYVVRDSGGQLRA
jgi:hypothetical protein